MLDRNRRIKPHPERFQEINGEKFDVVFTVEERIYDVVVEGEVLRLHLTCSHFPSFSELESRGSQTYSPTHIINIDITDNHDEATLGAFLFYEICQRVRAPTTVHRNLFLQNKKNLFKKTINKEKLLE